MLWRANMDLQYISETSLALTEYVSGYVTKAEKSNVQDIWNDISNSDSVYKCLFQFGMRSMRSREVRLYEASDVITCTKNLPQCNGLVPICLTKGKEC